MLFANEKSTHGELKMSETAASNESENVERYSRLASPCGSDQGTVGGRGSDTCSHDRERLRTVLPSKAIEKKNPLWAGGIYAVQAICFGSQIKVRGHPVMSG